MRGPHLPRLELELHEELPAARLHAVAVRAFGLRVRKVQLGGRGDGYGECWLGFTQSPYPELQVRHLSKAHVPA
eukprot:244845-Chlamydomonas_euryale.AAC.1